MELTLESAKARAERLRPRTVAAEYIAPRGAFLAALKLSPSSPCSVAAQSLGRPEGRLYIQKMVSTPGPPKDWAPSEQHLSTEGGRLSHARTTERGGWHLPDRGPHHVSPRNLPPDAVAARPHLQDGRVSMDARSPLPDAHFLARVLGGEVRRSSKTGDLYVVAPGPGRSPKDRSMTVFLGSQFPDGFWVTSHAGDDELAYRDYVNKVLGRPAWKPADKTDDIIGRMGAKARSSTRNTAKEQQEAPKKDQARSRKRFNDAYLLRAGYQQVAIYPYEVGDELLYQVLRYEHPTEGKRFLQRSPDGQDGWWGDAGDRKVLYRVNDLQKVAHDTAFVTEGEKDADRLASLDFVAVTVASGNWSEEALRALTGYECLILEDNDDPGRKRAQKAAAALHGIARCVRIVRLPGLSEKGDVSDWLDAGNDHNQLLDIAKAAPIWAPETEAEPEPEKESEGHALPSLVSRTSRSKPRRLVVEVCLRAGRDLLPGRRARKGQVRTCYGYLRACRRRSRLARLQV